MKDCATTFDRYCPLSSSTIAKIMPVAAEMLGDVHTGPSLVKASLQTTFTLGNCRCSSIASLDALAAMRPSSSPVAAREKVPVPTLPARVSRSSSTSESCASPPAWRRFLLSWHVVLPTKSTVSTCFGSNRSVATVRPHELETGPPMSDVYCERYSNLQPANLFAASKIDMGRRRSFISKCGWSTKDTRCFLAVRGSRPVGRAVPDTSSPITTPLARFSFNRLSPVSQKDEASCGTKGPLIPVLCWTPERPDGGTPPLLSIGRPR